MKNNSICVINIGTEIQRGYIQDTNFRFLADFINKRGCELNFHLSVSDDPREIIDAFEFCFNRSFTVITTGGLGPTADDITRQAIADYFGYPLKKNYQEEKRILQVLGSKSLSGIRCNEKQSFFPENSEVIENKSCTASGFACRKGKKLAIALPGVPSELRKIIINGQLDNYLPFCRQFTEDCRFFVLGYRESEVEDLIQSDRHVFNYPDYSIFCSFGMIMLSFRTKAGFDCNRIIQEAGSRFGINNIIEASDIYEALFIELQKKQLSVSFAESATGGLLSARLTEISGVSEVFPGSVVSYCDESKISLLGVDKSDINKHGAVSSKVSCQMAKGIRKLFNSDIGAGITGIAGPTGATAQKPVGLFFISVAYLDGIITREFILDGDRETRQQNAASRAVFMVLSMVRDIKRRL